MVVLYAQQRDNAVLDFIVLIDAGAVLLQTVKDLATVFALIVLEYDEMAALGLQYRPVTAVNSWACGCSRISLSMT